MAASVNRFCGVAHTGKLVKNVIEERDGCVSRVMDDWFYADGEETGENNGTSDGKWRDIDDDISAEWEVELKLKLLDSQSSRMPEKRCGRLEHLPHQYRSIVRVVIMLDRLEN